MRKNDVDYTLNWFLDSRHWVCIPHPSAFIPPFFVSSCIHLTNNRDFSISALNRVSNVSPKKRDTCSCLVNEYPWKVGEKKSRRVRVSRRRERKRAAMPVNLRRIQHKKQRWEDSGRKWYYCRLKSWLNIKNQSICCVCLGLFWENSFSEIIEDIFTLFWFS